MARKKKKIDTSVEHMEEVLARCPARAVRDLLACIEAQFIKPDDYYQQSKLEAIAAKVAEAQFQKREKRRKALLFSSLFCRKIFSCLYSAN